ncbi:MAG: hypothetical protein PHC77_02985 [Candidatus Marinimicrobia bacterium]|nr:hypothetical protein [Candidatus Neomarinimicrobiota bacterium]
MKNVSFALRKIIRLVLLVLISSILLFAGERNYSMKEGLPNIKDYPQEIQLFDSIKTDLFKNHIDSKGKLNKDISDEYIKKFAGVFIDYYMHYVNIHRKGFKYNYMKESYPMGLEMANKLSNLPYPWNLLLETKGFALAKIISDEKMPKGGFHPKNISVNEYVLEARIIEDIFNTYDGDTIYVRHNEPILETYPEYKDMDILFSFRSRGSIQRADSIQYIYLIGGKDEYMFVKKNTIYDPNNIIKEKNKGYKEFKEDLLSVLPKTSKAMKQP